VKSVDLRASTSSCFCCSSQRHRLLASPPASASFTERASKSFRHATTPSTHSETRFSCVTCATYLNSDADCSPSRSARTTHFLRRHPLQPKPTPATTTTSPRPASIETGRHPASIAAPLHQDCPIDYSARVSISVETRRLPRGQLTVQWSLSSIPDSRFNRPVGVRRDIGIAIRIAARVSTFSDGTLLPTARRISSQTNLPTD
jgi:hypothetical protein